MKYYSGLVIHSDDTSFYEGLTAEGLTLESELDAEDNASYRQVGYSNTYPLQVVSDFIVGYDKTVKVTLEETVDGESGSLGDIFTVFTYEDGVCVDVETEWVAC